MANHQQQQKMKKKIEHFCHKHPLTLVEIEDEEEMSKSEYRSSLRCYGCTEKISSGVPYYRCEGHCPFFCLHHACAHLPTTILREHSSCEGRVLQLKTRLWSWSRSSDPPFCSDCFQDWYRFGYICSDCDDGVDIRCAMRTPNEAKHSFHQHPVQPHFSLEVAANDLLCSVCSLILTPTLSCYRCNYCNFNVHPKCTNVPQIFDTPSHRHQLYLDFDYPSSKVCKICQEEIDRSTQWAYKCLERGCEDYFIHAAANDDCLTSTIRKADLQHFDHHHPLTFFQEEQEGDHSVAEEYCHCCRQKISSVPYYTCIHCNKYHLHKLCARLPTQIKHELHPKGPLKLRARLNVACDVCDEKCKEGFVYHCSPCNYNLDIECALRTKKIDRIFHKHPLFLSRAKAPYNCHACDRDTEDNSYQCTFCKFWVHVQCAALPKVKNISSHEHDLELVYSIPEKYSGAVVYCRICMKALKDHRWAYHCNRCRYLTHVHDCSNPQRVGDEVTIDASDVVHLPLAGEPMLEEKITNGKMTKHDRHPMILLADQFDSNAIDITRSFMDLIRGSTIWPTLHANGKDYSRFTFSFHDRILTMQVTGVDLPCYIKHEAHPHVLESTFLNSSTWCHACEQIFFGRGFKCTACAFTIDTYCALLPRIMKHRYDEHGFSLTYSAIEGVEEYVCEICEEDVIPRYFYHCEACDQSIHARCIWQAYVRFERSYKLDLLKWPVYLVPPSEELPQCFICDQKETFGHGFAFRCLKHNKFMVHLTCISDGDVGA